MLFSSSMSPSGESVTWRLWLCQNDESIYISIKPAFDTATRYNEISAKFKFMIRNSKGEDVTKLCLILF